MKRVHRHSSAGLMLIMVLAISGFALFRDRGFPTGKAVENLESFPRWESMPLLYRFENKEQCGTYQTRRIAWAFETIAKETSGTLAFQEDPSGTLIISCNRGFPTQVTGYLIQGEARYNVEDNGIIREAHVYFNNAGQNTYSGGCKDYPDVEVHEILHAFGFEHSENRLSIMYWQGTECRVDKFRIDEDILNKLKTIYTN